MGKAVLVIDLNPLSRTARMASVTIVDELSRVILNMNRMLLSGKTIQPPENFQNAQILQDALSHITIFLSSEI
jgi:4-phosphopantoate--beta-alanine ligase